MNTLHKLTAGVVLLGSISCSHSTTPVVTPPVTTTPVPTIAGVYHETDGVCWRADVCTGEQFQILIDTTNTAQLLFTKRTVTVVEIDKGGGGSKIDTVTERDTARIASSSYVGDSLTVSFTISTN